MPLNGNSICRQTGQEWINLQLQIQSKIEQIVNLGPFNASFKDQVEELGVLIHKNHDFYAHSSYADLWAEYYKRKNGTYPLMLPSFNEREILPSDFLQIMKTEGRKDSSDKYIGLYTGSFNNIKNEMVAQKASVLLNSWYDEEWKTNPNSHYNTNKDNPSFVLFENMSPKDYYGYIALYAAVRDTYSILNSLNQKLP